MRTLVQLALKPLVDKETTAAGRVGEWLQKVNLRPQPVTPDSIRAALSTLPAAESTEISHESLKEMDVALRHACVILRSIPPDDFERDTAIDTAISTVHFDDGHGNTIWGLVCLDFPSVTVRWKHHVSRALERATEALIDKIYDSSSEGIYEEFSAGQTIPVKEPEMTMEVYSGVITPPGISRREVAKKHKSTERKIALWALVLTGLCIAVGWPVSLYASAGTHAFYLGGVADRLATTAGVTSAISYLNYLFYVRELQRKPTIEWR